MCNFFCTQVQFSAPSLFKTLLSYKIFFYKSMFYYFIFIIPIWYTNCNSKVACF